MKKIIIIGSGAAGLSAALELAENGFQSILVSDMPSERAQSVMAEGGINAAANNEIDSPNLHAEETIKAGRYIVNPKAIYQMTEAAPEIIENLFSTGMSFTLNKDKKPDVRAFGGQSVKRTFFAAANTGKQLMYVLIDQVRKYEAVGLIERMCGWTFLKLLYCDNQAYGCILFHPITLEKKYVYGKIIIASGGLNGMFGNATGSVKNTGSVTANLFSSGVKFANGEFIQYHPTTVKLYGKNMLITEAVRGEGGRLYVLDNGNPIYFMEEKYPELGNLMPRDVIAKEEWMQIKRGKKIYLDMRYLDAMVYESKLEGVINDCIRFLNLDPRKEPIPILPGIHYFMCGIWVDADHRTSMKNLYASGECACQYHGANRLGGNSLLGALYGGRVAARSALEDEEVSECLDIEDKIPKNKNNVSGSYTKNWKCMQSVLKNGLCIDRNEESLKNAVAKLDRIVERLDKEYDDTATEAENLAIFDCCVLGKAMLLCALERKESRGAHNRSDYPTENEEYRKQTVAELVKGIIRIYFQKVGDENDN